MTLSCSRAGWPAANHTFRRAHCGQKTVPLRFGLASDGDVKPANGRRSVSSALPHIAFQRVEVRAGRFSEGIFGHTPKTYTFTAQLFSGELRAHTKRAARTAVHRQAKISSRNLINIATQFAHRQLSFLHPTKRFPILLKRFAASTLEVSQSKQRSSGGKRIRAGRMNGQARFDHFGGKHPLINLNHRRS